MEVFTMQRLLDKGPHVPIVRAQVFIEVIKDSHELFSHLIPGRWNPGAPLPRLDSPEDVLDRVEVWGVRGRYLWLTPFRPK